MTCSASCSFSEGETVTDKWQPKKGRKYYWITSSTQTTNMHARIKQKIWEDDDLDHSLFDSNNCFRNKAEAQFVYKSFHGKF